MPATDALYNVLRQAAVVDYTKATTQDALALAQERQVQTQIMQNKLAGDQITRQVLSQFAQGIGPNTDPSSQVMPDDSPAVAASKTARAAQMQSQQYRNIATALSRAGADPDTVMKYNKEAIDQNYRAIQSSREAKEEQLAYTRAAASVAASVQPGDEDSFNIANDRLSKIMDPQTYRALPFQRDHLGQPIYSDKSVRVMQTIAAQGRTAQEQAALTAKVEADQARIAKQKVDEQVAAARVQQIQSQTALNQTRAKVLENPVARPSSAAAAKPKPITPANKQERDAADSAIDAEDFGDKGEGAKWDPAARKAYSNDVADRARKLFISAQNSGQELSLDDARQQAIDDLKPYVQGKTIKSGGVAGFFQNEDKLLTYKRGASPTAAAGPAQIKSQAEYDALPKGATYVFDGKQGVKR